MENTSITTEGKLVVYVGGNYYKTPRLLTYEEVMAKRIELTLKYQSAMTTVKTLSIEEVLDRHNISWKRS